MAFKILLTGAGGFIGKNLLRLLKNKGFELHATTSRNIPKGIETTETTWHVVDLLDCYGVQNLIGDLRPDYILHLAWDTTPGKYLTNPQNLDWVAATLGICKVFYENGGKRAVFAGTCFEYNPYDAILSENSSGFPSSLYGTCKLALSGIITKFCEDQGVSFAWGRIFYLFGPYENEKRVIPYVIRSLLSGKEALCSDAYAKKDYLYVEDVAAALFHLLNIDENGIFNIGSGTAVPLRDILLLAAKLIGRSDLLKLGALAQTNEAPMIEAVTTKLAKTGFSQKYSIEEGLEKTVGWWRTQIFEKP